MTPLVQNLSNTWNEFEPHLTAKLNDRKVQKVAAITLAGVGATFLTSALFLSSTFFLKVIILLFIRIPLFIGATATIAAAAFINAKMNPRLV